MRDRRYTRRGLPEERHWRKCCGGYQMVQRRKHSTTSGNHRKGFMTTGHHPVVRTSLLLLLLAGCGDVERKYQVGNPAHVYCPPSASDVTPTRLARGALENGGSAFRGCARTSSACDARLKDVLAAWVGTPDGPEDAYRRGHIGTWSNSDQREPSLDPASSRFLVRDETKQRYIFNTGDNTLIAVCDGETCTRSFRYDGMQYGYTFQTPEKFAGDVTTLDRVLVEVVRGWQCSESPKPS